MTNLSLPDRAAARGYAQRMLELAGMNPSRVARVTPAERALLHELVELEVALSASSPSGPVTIAGVRGGYSAALLAAYGLTWSRLIASDFPTTDSPSETYPWLRSAPIPRKWEGERTVQELRSDVVTIVNDSYESTIEFKVPDFRRDKVGQIAARIRDLATRVAFFPEHLITALLVANGNAYDGKAFFATDHAVGSSGTINNAIVAADGLAGGDNPTSAEQAANIGFLLSRLLAFLDDRGQPFNEAARAFVVMVPPNQFGSTVAAINAAFTSAASSNPLAELAEFGYSFVPVVNARLTTKNQLYLFRADAGIRSMLMQSTGVDPTELGPDSEHAKKTNRVLFGHGWEGGVGYGRFELAIRGTTS